MVVEYRGAGRVVRPLAIKAISLSHKTSTTLSHELVPLRQVCCHNSRQDDTVEGAGAADAGNAGGDLFDVAQVQ